MTKEYISVINTNEDVNYKGVTLLQREDGSWAVPGTGHILDKGDAKKAAENLWKSHKGIKSPIGNLVHKTVTRLQGASSDTSVMGA